MFMDVPFVEVGERVKRAHMIVLLSKSLLLMGI